MDNQFFGKRLNEELGNNELRDYLANKEETSLGIIPKVYEPDLRTFCEPYERPVRTLLISPPITIPRDMQKRCIPPLGLSYIGAALEAKGMDVAMLDCMVEGYSCEEYSGNLMTYGLTMEMLEERLKSMPAPDVVGISVLFSTDLHNLFNVTRVIKKVLPRAIVVAGGLHPTIYPKEIFELDQSLNGSQRTVDFVIRGEGEERFPAFVKLLQSGKVDKNADGLVGFVEGEFFCNYQRATIEDLDSLAFPAYHLLPMEKYLQINVPFSPVPQGNRVAQILTSRGCPIGCSFCASSNMYKKYRHRSVENVMAEINQLKERYNIDEIQFADDNLTLNREHSVEFFTALKEANLKWCTPNGTMVNTLTPELLDLMARSGLYQITLSLDSANAKTLKNLHHKPVNLNSIPGLIAKAKEYGIFTHGTLVVGMPGETVEDIEEGFEFVLNHLPLTSISTFIAAAIPGSELYHQSLDKGLITKEDARRIDTTRSKIHLSDIPSAQLEKMVMDFQEKFTTTAKLRDPEEYARKYKKLIDMGRLQGAYGGRLT
ncbi:MAG: cobalamin-dependent protein [Cyanobacteria bacterium SZAS LIN-2]|nr:cobalamin-dependent protein [Cyanobacteria bacterium SZAS LIN-2]